MKLDIGGLLQQPGIVNYDVDQSCPPGLGIECSGPVTGFLQFSSTGNLLLIRGGLDAQVRLECGRCLEEFAIPVHADVEEEFRVRPGEVIAEVDDEEEIAGPADENVMAIFEGVNLRLDELIRQHLLLAIPPFPACSEECRGLCAGCGHNLNETACICRPAALESPFAVLAQRLRRE